MLDSQTFGGIRPAAMRHPYRGGGYRLTPASRGFGHLLTMSACRNPAPSRDAAAGLTVVCTRSVKPFGSEGQGSRASPEADPLLQAKQLAHRGRDRGRQSARPGGAKAPNWTEWPTPQARPQTRHAYSVPGHKSMSHVLAMTSGKVHFRQWTEYTVPNHFFRQEEV